MFEDIFSDSAKKQSFDTHVAYVFGSNAEGVVRSALDERFSSVTYQDHDEDIDLVNRCTLFFYQPSMIYEELKSFFDELADRYHSVENVVNIIVIGHVDSLSLMSNAKEIGILYFSSESFLSLFSSVDIGQKRSVILRAQSVLVIGMSGGVGASTIASCLLKILADSGKRGLMVDSNTVSPIQSFLLNENQHSAFEPGTLADFNTYDFRLTKCLSGKYSLMYCNDNEFRFDEGLHKVILSKNRYVISDCSAYISCENYIHLYKNILLVVNSSINSFINLGRFLSKHSMIDRSKITIVYNNTHPKEASVLASDYKKNFPSLNLIVLPFVELKPAAADACFSSFFDSIPYNKNLKNMCEVIFGVSVKEDIKKGRLRQLFYRDKS
ncbi:TPA: hypothetical protein RQN76_004318 [Aeromonas dhakensis]|nr:hypothetical protein [Aeromonas dhakensis]